MCMVQSEVCAWCGVKCVCMVQSEVCAWCGVKCVDGVE